MSMVIRSPNVLPRIREEKHEADASSKSGSFDPDAETPQYDP